MISEYIWRCYIDTPDPFPTVRPDPQSDDFPIRDVVEVKKVPWIDQCLEQALGGRDD